MTSRILNRFNIKTDILLRSIATDKLSCDIHPRKMIKMVRRVSRDHIIIIDNYYLHALHYMHPYLAAAGHNNYTKYLALFIPRMLDVEHTHPSVYEAFMRGLFPVRRTDSAWSGIFTYIFIEQVLMTGIKSSGGLTHDRGFSESTRLLFLLSRTICADVSQSYLPAGRTISN